jgi:flagellar basal body rod protein FlgC
MAVGDEAQAQGYSIVPNTDIVKNGAQEINRTRDYVAEVKVLVPTGKAAYRNAVGITSGTADPTGGNDGDIYFKILS